jgi:hypothetical protein
MSLVRLIIISKVRYVFIDSDILAMISVFSSYKTPFCRFSVCEGVDAWGVWHLFAIFWELCDSMKT